MNVDQWGADVIPSVPEAATREVKVSMGGFGFTTAGLQHDISDADVEEMLMPFFAPPDFGAFGGID